MKRCFLTVCLEGLKKTMKDRSYDNQCPSRDSNWAPFEYTSQKPYCLTKSARSNEFLTSTGTASRPGRCSFCGRNPRWDPVGFRAGMNVVESKEVSGQSRACRNKHLNCSRCQEFSFGFRGLNELLSEDTSDAVLHWKMISTNVLILIRIIIFLF